MDLNFLPKLNYLNYAWEKSDNPNITKNSWLLSEASYSRADLNRYKHIVYENLDFIKDKKILDIGCSVGVLSLICLHNHCEHVTGIDVRDIQLSIAKDTCEFAGYNNHTFKFLNIHELDQLKDECDKVDTILMSGVFYHVNHHALLMETISKSNAQNIIIESQVFLDCPSMPALFWRLENSGDIHHGMERDNSIKNIAVGVPNRNFIEKMLMLCGYKVTYNEQFDYLKNDGLTRHTCVIAGIKNQSNYQNPLFKKSVL